MLKRFRVLSIDFDHLSLFDVFFQVVVKWQGLQLCSGQDRSEGDRDDDGDDDDGEDDDGDDGDNGRYCSRPTMTKWQLHCRLTGHMDKGHLDL